MTLTAQVPDGSPADRRAPTAPLDVAALDPGPLLAAELEDVDPRSVDEYNLVEMIAGYQRVAAWAQARMTELTGVLARRPALNPHHPLPGGEYSTNVTAEELAPRLGLSRFAAKRMVTNARAFHHKLEDTGTALRDGQIDYPKACTLVRLLADQPSDVAWEVQQIVLPDAPHQSHTQLTRAVQAAIIAIDPHRATQRHRRARDTRRVDHPRPLPDGMASLFACCPRPMLPAWIWHWRPPREARRRRGTRGRSTSCGPMAWH